MKTILIVDDDEDDKDFLCDAIHSLDESIKCLQVSNEEHALRLLQDEYFLPPDFIFLDLNMPRLGGKQCLMRIKNIPRLAHIPIIIYTTSKLKDDLFESMHLGAVYFLTKPTKLSELKEYVSFVLEQDWQQQAEEEGKIVRLGKP